MTAVGTPQAHAAALADVLVAADCRGHFSHGLNRLGKEIQVKKLILLINKYNKYIHNHIKYIFLYSLS